MAVPVVFDHHARLGQRPQQIPVQALVAQAPVETLDEELAA